MSNQDFVKQAAIGLVAAIIGVIVVYFIAQAISPDLRADSIQGDNEKITVFGALMAVVFQSVLAVIVGWILFHFRKPRTWWYAIAVIVLIFSAFNAFSSANTDETAIWLNIMHLVAAGAIVPAIARMLPER
jgi:Family of unknown function (DUF6069)